MTTLPTRVSYNVPTTGNYTSTTSPKITNAFDVVKDDLIVVIGSTEDTGSSLNTPTATGGSITWTLRQSVTTSNFSHIRLWTGAVGANANGITVSVTRSGSTTHFWGFSATVYRNHGGVGVSIAGTQNNVAPSLALNGCSAGSIVQMGINDWNAVSGASRTWRTVDGTTPTPAVGGNGYETLYTFTSGRHTTYGAYWPTTSAGNKTLGLTQPTGQKPAMVAIEILGSEESLTPVSASRSTSWETRSASSSTRSTSWRTNSVVQQGHSTTWTVRTSAAAARATTWSAREMVAAARATTWDVDGLEAVAASRSTIWAVAAGVAATRASSWETRASLTPVTRATSWSVLSGTQRSCNATWSVFQTASAGRGTSWAVAGQIAASRASSWSVLAPVAASRVALWDTEGTLLLVTASRSTGWRVEAITQVSASRTALWSSRASVLSDPRAASWSVLSGTQRSCNATWDVREIVSPIRSTQWAVRREVAVARLTSWAVLVPVSASRGTSWAVAGVAYGPPAKAWLAGRLVAAKVGARRVLIGDIKRQTEAEIRLNGRSP